MPATAIEQLPRSVRLACFLGLAVICGVGDYLTGADLGFTTLYLIPISLEAWFGSRLGALLIGGACSVAWLATDWLTRAHTGTAFLTVWNFGVELSVFAGAAVLVSALRHALVEERRALNAEHQRRLDAQEQLRHAERLVTVGRLAAGVAHELGTPLNVAQTYAQLLETDSLELDERKPAATTIREQTEAMTRIVRQLLDFARAGKGERAEHDAGEVISASLAMLQPLARKSDVALKWEPGPAVKVLVDVAQLQQVLTNLIVNAVQALTRGGTVMVTLQHRERQACIQVTDDGPGIAPEILPHLFEPFMTTKQVGTGTGLGLAVAFGIVNEHGGTLTGENLSRGARFTVTLPSEAA